jgi:DNA-binding NarL/FixJ family response regulator
MTTPTAVRVVIADDHPIFRDGLRRLLESEPGFHVVGEAQTPQEAVSAVRRHVPDLLLLDLMMPGGGGLAALRHLVAEPTPTRVVLLTAAIEHNEQVAAASLGVRGIITKESATAQLFKCLRAVMSGQYWLGTQSVADLSSAVKERPRHAPSTVLTPRELEIVAAIVDGATNREIANQFDVSQQTVKNHLSSIFDKLGVSTRLELALYAIKHNLIGPLPPDRRIGRS